MDLAAKALVVRCGVLLCCVVQLSCAVSCAAELNLALVRSSMSTLCLVAVYCRGSDREVVRFCCSRHYYQR